MESHRQKDPVQNNENKNSVAGVGKDSGTRQTNRSQMGKSKGRMQREDNQMIGNSCEGGGTNLQATKLKTHK